MNTVKQLPKGIPEGYKPQRQTPKSDAYLMVSDYTRRIAHELDTMHRDWIMRRKEIEPEILDESPLADEQVDHLEWLTDPDHVYERYEMLLERRIVLQGILGQMRLSHKQNGIVLSKGQFVSRHEALRAEFDYLCLLQAQVKAHMGVMPGRTLKRRGTSHQEKLSVIRDRLRSDQSTDENLLLLIEMDEALREWFREWQPGDDDVPKRVRAAMDCTKQVLNHIAQWRQPE